MNVGTLNAARLRRQGEDRDCGRLALWRWPGGLGPWSCVGTLLLAAMSGCEDSLVSPSESPSAGRSTLTSADARLQAPFPARADVACQVASVLDFPVEGYGASTVGGWQDGHQVRCVTSLEDDGPGSLRDALRTGDFPTVIGFALDGEIRLSVPLVLPSHVSIDGRGHDVRLVGKGLVAHGVEDIILTHLAIQDVGPDSEDGIQLGFPDLPPVRRVVLDHLTFAQSDDSGSAEHVDEAVSVIFGSHDITLAWCRFTAWEKVMLFGNGDASPEVDSAIRVTVHHTWFESTGRRHPQARFGIFDFYNNFLDDWQMFAPVGPPVWHESFGAQCEDDCRLLYDANIFERHWHEYDAFSQANQASRCQSGGEITDRGGWVTPETSVRLRFNVHCPAGDLARPYPAQVDPPDGDLMRRLMAETGHLGGD